MKIFVTGVAGFLGSHLADAMLAEGHYVVGIDNLIGGELDNVPSRVDFHQFDCNDFDHRRASPNRFANPQPYRHWPWDRSCER